MTQKKSQNELITVGSVEEAEKQVYKMIQQNKNFREITKIGFSINDVVKRFNPSQISQIKAKFEPKMPQNHLDPDKAKVFVLFKKNKKPTDVVIETGLSYEYVKQSYQEYLEFENKTSVPNYWLNNLEEFAFYITEPNGMSRLAHIHHAFSVAKNSHSELENHIYYCCRCGEEIPIRGKSLQAACDYLSKNWGHTECINNSRN